MHRSQVSVTVTKINTSFFTERRCYSGASESACLKCCASVTMLTGIEPSGAYVKLTWCPPCFGADRDPTFSATCPVTAPTVPSSGDQPANPCTGGESVYGRRTGGKPVYGRQIRVRDLAKLVGKVRRRACGGARPCSGLAAG